MSHALSPSLLVVVDGESPPLARDVDIAAALGMARPRDIRPVIDANRPEFEALGGLRSVPANPGPRGGRPTTEYLLTEEQALLLCALSRAPRAAEVRRALIRVFAAFRRGELGSPNSLDAQRIGGIIKAVTSRLAHDLLNQHLPAMIEAHLARDPRVAVLEYLSANEVCIDEGAPPKGRRTLTLIVGNRLRSFCAERGIPCRRESRRRVWVYPANAVSEWLALDGRALIRDWTAARAGQPTLFVIAGGKQRRASP